MVTETQVQQILDELSTDQEFFLVNLKIGNSKIKQKITVLVDTDNGIGIDDCSRISYELGKLFDEHIGTAYTLEVSSPGVDQPLRWPRQYKKNVGRQFNVVKTDDTEIIGELTEADLENIKIQPTQTKKDKIKPEILTISLLEIKEAKVQISFR